VPSFDDFMAARSEREQDRQGKGKGVGTKGKGKAKAKDASRVSVSPVCVYMGKQEMHFKMRRPEGEKLFGK
jgi:hypothetical protein